MGAQLTISPRHYVTAADSFTRPSNTTPYADTDLVANSETAGSVVPLSWVLPYGHTYTLQGIRLRKSGTEDSNASFRLHLYDAEPTVTNGDNGTFVSSGVANYIASAPVVMMAFSDGAGQLAFLTTPIGFGPITARTIYGLVEAEASYTPASAEVFTAQLIIG